MLKIMYKTIDDRGGGEDWNESKIKAKKKDKEENTRTGKLNLRAF